MDDKLISTRTPHLSAKELSMLADVIRDVATLFEKRIVGYSELCEELGISRRAVERLVSLDIIQKIPNTRPARFYLADVLAGLRSQKGYRRYAD